MYSISPPARFCPLINMPESNVKNQHYVPQAYLRFFAKKSEQVWVYDKSSGKKFSANIRNVASEKYFYDSATLEKVTGQRQFIEKRLSSLEGRYSEVCKALIKNLQSGEFKYISPSMRHFFSVYLVVQMLRTKEHRIHIKQHTETLAALIQQRYVKEGLPPPSTEQLTQGQSIDDLSQELQNTKLLDGSVIEEFSLILYRHIWIIQEAFKDQQFLTSDHPFVKTPHVKHPWRSMSGIRSLGIEILFPLSPKYILTLVERTHFGGLTPFDGKRLRMTSSENMVYCNQFQIYQSNRFLFSQNGNFDFAEEILREEPIHGNIDRVRLATNHDEELRRADGVHRSQLLNL